MDTRHFPHEYPAYVSGAGDGLTGPDATGGPADSDLASNVNHGEFGQDESCLYAPSGTGVDRLVVGPRSCERSRSAVDAPVHALG